MSEAPPQDQPHYLPPIVPILSNHYCDLMHPYRFGYNPYYYPNFNTSAIASSNNFGAPVLSLPSHSTIVTESTATTPDECNSFGNQHIEYYQEQSSSNSSSNCDASKFYQTHPFMSNCASVSGEVNNNEASEFRQEKFSSINCSDRKSYDETMSHFGIRYSANGIFDEPVVGYHQQSSINNCSNVVGDTQAQVCYESKFSTNNFLKIEENDQFQERYEAKFPSDNLSAEVQNDEVKGNCETKFPSNICSDGVQDDRAKENHETQPSTNNNSNGLSHAKDKKNPKEVSKCELCNRVFKSLCYLKQHNSARHSPSKLHRCKKCSKRYSTEEELEAHFVKHNSGPKPYPCDGCDKSFHYNSDLRRHTRLHTRNLFPCTICGKGFTRKGHAESHQKKHLKKANDKIWTSLC